MSTEIDIIEKAIDKIGASDDFKIQEETITGVIDDQFFRLYFSPFIDHLAQKVALKVVILVDQREMLNYNCYDNEIDKVLFAFAYAQDKYYDLINESKRQQAQLMLNKLSQML